MPTLLGFLPCEKIIFEKDTNKVSLISIMHDVFIPVIRSVAIPEGTVAPLKWSAVAIWHRGDLDANVWWEQVITLTGDSGEIPLQCAPLRFQIENPVIRAFHDF